MHEREIKLKMYEEKRWLEKKLFEIRRDLNSLSNEMRYV